MVDSPHFRKTLRGHNRDQVDRPIKGVPEAQEMGSMLAPDSVSHAEFKITLVGYKADEVHAYLSNLEKTVRRGNDKGSPR